MLLFDQNLSPSLISRLVDLFPGSTHTHLEGLARADDVAIWAFARDRGLIIVTKDADYPELVALRGAPPKVIWLRLGNCTTDEVAATLRDQLDQVIVFLANQSVGLLILPLSRET